SGRIALVDWNSSRRRVIDLNQKGFENSYTGDLAFDHVRGILYVADQANFRIVVIDASKRTILTSIATGRLPFAMALSPDRTKLYVCNLGMFQYRPIPGSPGKDPGASGLSFPAFGFPSAEAVTGVRLQTSSGSIDIPGLGDANGDQANALCIIDVS